MTKKRLLVISCLVLALIMVFAVGCPREEQPDAGLTPPPGDQITRGGTLRILSGAGPAALGHPIRHSPGEWVARLPAVESLLVASNDRGEMVGRLAEAWDEDIENKQITFKLREGVKFHDGSELTAEAVKWNFQNRIGAGTLRFADFIREVEAVDKYNFRIHLNDWNNLILLEWGITHIFSMEGYKAKQAELGDAWEEWATYNVIGTGPFKLVVYTRDVEMIWERFEDYWQEGYPYLDRVHYIFIPDPTTAAAMMEAGEADMWMGAPADQIDRLVDMGLTRQASWPSTQWHIMPQTVNPASPFVDKRIREALWYAIDRQSMADALGYGYWTPLNTVAPPGDWGGDRVFREFNPEKARQLVAEAGYPDGLPVTLLAQAGPGGRNTTAEAVAYMLNAAGFIVTIDIADAGRFSGAVWANGWEQLVIMFSGTDITYHLATQRWWGHNGVFRHSFQRTEEMLELSQRSLTARTLAAQRRITEQIVYEMAEEALIVPLVSAPMAFLHNGRVHVTWLAEAGSRRDYHDMWLEQE